MTNARSPRSTITASFGIGLALATGALVAGSAFAQSAPDVAPEVTERAAKIYPDLQKVYEDIHSHPELGFHETRTAALLAKDIRALGFTVTEKVGGTGVVALYRNGAGPTVMVRTELDALPMEEKTGCRMRATSRRCRTGARRSSRTAAATTSRWRTGRRTVDPRSAPAAGSPRTKRSAGHVRSGRRVRPSTRPRSPSGRRA